MWLYYGKLRGANDFESVNQLIVADKMFEMLDSETATHIGVLQGEEWYKPRDLGQQCDIFYASKGKSYDEPERAKCNDSEKRSFNGSGGGVSEDKLSKLVKTSISVDGKLVHALVDSGTEITVIKKDLVPGISVEGASTIYLKGIFGPAVKCPLVYVPIGLATGGQVNVWCTSKCYVLWQKFYLEDVASTRGLDMLGGAQSEENSLAQSSRDLRVDSGNVDETEVSSGGACKEPLPAPGNRSNERRYKEKDLARTEGKKGRNGGERERAVGEESRGRKKPQANRTERVNRDLVQMIANYVNEQHDTWDQFLREFAYAIRTAVNETTGKTPAELFLGRKLITPFQKLVMVSDGTEFAVGDIERLFEKARRNTETKHENWKKYYNRRRRDVQIKVRIYRHRKCDETEIGTGNSDNGSLHDESSSFDRGQRRSNDSRDGKNKGSEVKRELEEKGLSFRNNQGEKHTNETNKRRPLIRSIPSSWSEKDRMIKRGKKERLSYKRSHESRSGGPERKVQKGSEHRVNKRALSSNYKTNHSLTKYRKKSRREETVTPTTSGYNFRPRIG
ncbi:uncharacterized protein TNCV_2653091 [Trichonephila clavipes]|nr:uncharacterized protein TNCV_2653091 [Trichonephila clavipes]